MYSKKGVSGHVEIIISFVIFLAFVSFLLFYINPIEENNKTTYHIDLAERAILERLTVPVTSFSVTVDNTAWPSITNCFCFQYSFNSANKVAAFNERGVRTGAAKFFGGTKICVEPTNSGITNDKFYRLYFSEDITEVSGPCTGGSSDYDLAEGTEYRLGVRNEYKFISRKKIGNTVDATTLVYEYTNNYDNLRSNLGIATDFNLVIEDMENGVIMPDIILRNREPPKSQNIMAKDIYIEIINSDGSIIPAKMNLQVWE